MAGRGKKRTVGKLFLQFSTGSGGNVGRAIYARDLSRDKSRGEYICAHMSPPLKEHARRRRRHHTEEEQDLCVSWHRLTTPFSRSSFRSTSTSSSSSYSRLIAPFSARAIFRPRLSPPTRLPFFLRPSAIRTRQRGNTRAIYPVFRNASEYPHVSCQPRDGARTRKGNSFVIPVEYSYESCVNNTKRRERRDGRD